jgi:hypothetical protein
MTRVNSSKTFEFLNLLRGFIPSGYYVPATLLLAETKSECKEDEAILSSEDRIYKTMLAIADRLEIANPFNDLDQFIRLYNATPTDFSFFDWAAVIERDYRADRRLKSSEILFEQYLSRLNTEAKSIFIAEGDKFAESLRSVVGAFPDKEFVISTEMPLNVLLLNKLLCGLENVNVLQTSIYEYGFLEQRFDLIISLPNFGTRTLVDDQNFISRDQEAVALENLLLHLNTEGQLLITLPARITFSQDKSVELRKFIQRTYQILEISELPEGLIEGTGIKTYLFSIANNKPADEEIIIRRYIVSKRSKNNSIEELDVDDETFVLTDELEEQGDWSINKIFAQQDEDWLKYQESNIRKLPLSEVSEIFRGKSVNVRDSRGSVGYINISNIGDYDIDYENLDFVNENERNIMNYLLKSGDVLLPARGTAIRTAVFTEQNFPCIASSNVIAIRPKETLLNSTYLKIFLDSPLGNKLISSMQQGVTVLSISYRDLLGLEVPVPEISEQERIADLYNKELKIYQKSLADAEQRWEKVRSELQGV